MACYFMHLRDGTDELLDPDGGEYLDMEALRKADVAGARDVICGKIKASGLLDYRYRIDAEDERGRIVYTLSFKGAVKIIAEDR